ncbi:MAG: TIGR01244 family sulfur transferase [Limnobacter sp.]|uniref:bifunctional protein tyrosine phosphatase family protein/NAD(P)/FAD-dependent oxidoreductase n=1 Tax=Limnobacter sp. TaxID=2003368 RepID=UPI0022BEB751|nr:bifunctional protein tyrosine phosphatase family protein/NAD(P)/FAD-dependent oxidoreductase [Limnobacter sp.]MCZ8014826.1 TIGR01244 family sulfur transferase [Limnobacter sp.]
MSKQLDNQLTVSGQLDTEDIKRLAATGFKTIVNNRPDGEEANQPSNAQLQALAEGLGLNWVYLPLTAGQKPDANLAQSFRDVMDTLPRPAHVFCRTGRRSEMIHQAASALPAQTNGATHYDVVIVGAGTAGVSVATSILNRSTGLRIALVDPARTHDYQAAWTLVGAGEFEATQTRKPMVEVIPRGVNWLAKAVESFQPEHNQITLADGSKLAYDQLVVCPGLKLNWHAIEGLTEALGSNGVTSNYRYDLAQYTWELVQKTRKGRALFTQPAMPIKCAGAPQKAMYLSCSNWEEKKVLGNIEVEMYNAGAVVFGVPTFVPPLMEYIKRYNAQVNFSHNLVKIDGPSKTATFEVISPDGEKRRVERTFDMIHVVPPQVAPDFVAKSPLANAAGWVDVDQHTLQHVRYPNVFGLGDAGSMPNAKTTAAIRKQAPIVANNLIRVRQGLAPQADYDGYGACPLTVEKGKVVLAEFSYGGKLAPTFPLNPAVPRRLNWMLKKHVFPALYWFGALKGREWLTACAKLDSKV